MTTRHETSKTSKTISATRKYVDRHIHNNLWQAYVTMCEITITLPLPPSRMSAIHAEKPTGRLESSARECLITVLPFTAPYLHCSAVAVLESLNSWVKQSAQHYAPTWKSIPILRRLQLPDKDNIENHTSVKVGRWVARYIHNWIWLGLTMTFLIVIYLFRASTIRPFIVAMVLNIFYCVQTLFNVAPLPRLPPTYALIWNLIWNAGRPGFVLLYTIWMIRSDYSNFIALGPGGTPQTWNGFKRVSLLEILGKIDVAKPPPNPSGQQGYLKDLEVRQGERPKVAGIAPHHQLNQRSKPDIYKYLEGRVFRWNAKTASRIQIETSFMEKHTKGIRAQRDRITQKRFHTFGGEIAHPHKVGGSLHVMLHPADIETVINMCWGERHPIANVSTSWLWYFFSFEDRPPIPEHMCLIYAPRNRAEVLIVERIVKAGIAFVAGPGAEDDEASNEADLAKGHWDTVAELRKSGIGGIRASS